MTAEVVGAILAFGYTASILCGIVLLLYLIEVRDWPGRPAFAAYVIAAALGPISAVPLVLLSLWLLGRFTARGAREAWHLVRPAAADKNIPRARVR